MIVSPHVCKTTLGIHSCMHTALPKLPYLQICNCYVHEAAVAFHCMMHTDHECALIMIQYFHHRCYHEARENDLCLRTHRNKLQELNYVYVSLGFRHRQALPNLSDAIEICVRSRTSLVVASFFISNMTGSSWLSPAIHCHQDYKELILLNICGSTQPPGN